MTSRYVVLLPGDESSWESASPEERTRVYGRHEEFARRLAEAGHSVVGGAELAHSREAKLVRADAAGTVAVTDGPYAETVEQLTGYYEVETDDLDGLLQIVGVIAGPDHSSTGMGGVEVRRVLGAEDRASS